MDINGVEAYIEKTTKLIERERSAEIEETRTLQEQVPLKELQRRGVCLLKLHISSHYTGLYGRTVLVFGPYWQGKELPSHNFTPGDIAGLQVSQGTGDISDMLASGIVSRVSSTAIHVAFEESFDQLDVDDNTPYKLLKLANDVTYKRLKKCLEELENYQRNEHSLLVSVLFGETEPGPPLCEARDGAQSDIFFYNTNLDESQQEAVKFVLQQRDVGIIHGPPGTGKTTTVTEVIMQEVKRKNKLLVCAPSNIAVDNLVEKLAVYKTRMVRLGHPARVLESIQAYSLDAILSHSDQTKLVTDVRKDIDQALSKMKKTRNKGERQRMKEDLRHLRKELRTRETKAIKEILHNVDVVLCTLTMASSQGPLKHVEKKYFDMVVIDECSQSMEVACWIALQNANRCMLAGDHNQLPPTIISHSAAKEGLAFTLMERLLKLYGDKVMRMLTTQYRMHEDIMQWPSDQLYQGKLTAHKSVSKHLLKDLEETHDTDLMSTAVLLIDTAGCDLPELALVDEMSKGNEGEADIVTYHVDQLIQDGVRPTDIAVIAPYNLQVELLRLRLSHKYQGLEIKSVDGFQGREKEAVIISMVRSNDKGVVGFLAEDRRINVAITRARRHLAVICDSETVSHHKFLKSMIDYLSEHGDVKSAQEYIDAGALSTEHKRPEHLDDRLSNHSNQQKHKPTPENQEQQNKKLHQNKPHPKSQSARNTAKPQTKHVPEDQNKTNDTQIESEWSMEVIQKHITDLMISDSQNYAFPSTLTGNERKTVHEICEGLELQHISVGVGRDRHIVVSKSMDAKNTKTDQQMDRIPGKSDAAELHKQDTSTSVKVDSPEARSVQISDSSTCGKCTELNPVSSQSSTTICDKCQKHIPVANYDLHSLRCTGTKGTQKLEAKGAKSKKAKPKSAKMKPQTADNTGPEDFDSLIADAIKQNTTCFYPKCKNNAATLGTNCQFCVKRFCLTHHIAEAHGCGNAAKVHARATISREGVLYRGSGVPDKKPDPTKRAHLERKLNKKLDQLADKRKHKRDT